MESEKPSCKLLGENGNVFNIMMLVSQCLKKAGRPEQAEKFEKAAVECESYEHVLRLVTEYVEVK